MGKLGQFRDAAEGIDAWGKVIDAQAEAELAMERHMCSACDGNARSGKIVAQAASTLRLTRLLRQVRPAHGDLAILARYTDRLRNSL